MAPRIRRAAKTIEYDPEIEKGRIIFKGEVASDKIRNKYLGKHVKGYTKGEKQIRSKSLRLIVIDTRAVKNHDDKS